MTKKIAQDVSKLTNRGREIFGPTSIKDSPNASISITISGSFNQPITSEARITFDQIDKTDPALADNIAALTAELERSNNKEAWECWMDFLEEARTQKRQSRLSAYWDRVVKLVPQVTDLVENAAKITHIFTG
jgi:hypothetical protein